MKILLQDTKTGFYYQTPDAWIENIKAASDFRTSQQALEYVQSRGLSDVQIVAVFIGGSYVESIPYPLSNSPRLRIRV